MFCGSGAVAFAGCAAARSWPRRSARTDAEGGAPSSASWDGETDEPPAADDAMPSPCPLPLAAPMRSCESVAGTAIGGSAAPWKLTWSVSAGR